MTASETARAAAKIMAAWQAGMRFAPVDWPPGWRPAAWEPTYRASPAQLAALAITRANANALQHKAGPLSRRKFTGD